MYDRCLKSDYSPELADLGEDQDLSAEAFGDSYVSVHEVDPLDLLFGVLRLEVEDFARAFDDDAAQQSLLEVLFFLSIDDFEGEVVEVEHSVGESRVFFLIPRKDAVSQGAKPGLLEGKQPASRGRCWATSS